MGAQFSLSPTMVSRKLAALAFIRDYIEQRGASPSLGEIAQALGVDDRKTAMKAVRALERDGHILRRPGPRGIMLPDRIAEALRQLRQAGFVVNEDILHPGAALSRATLSPLPLVPAFEDVSLEE